MNRAAIRAIAAQKVLAEMAAFALQPFQVVKPNMLDTLRKTNTFVPVCQYLPTKIMQVGEVGTFDGVRYKLDTRKKR